MMKAKYNLPQGLIDAQARALDYPDTFEVPTLAECAEVKPGQHVKICAGDIERFWCLVAENVDGQLLCEIDNDLVCTEIHGLNYKDPIIVEYKNVYTIGPSV